MDGTVQSLKTELSFVDPMISRLELNEAIDKLEYINDKLDEMYDLIEHEVKAKNEVEETKDVITDDLFKVQRYELYIKNRNWICSWVLLFNEFRRQIGTHSEIVNKC